MHGDTCSVTVINFRDAALMVPGPIKVMYNWRHRVILAKRVHPSRTLRVLSFKHLIRNIKFILL